MPTKAAAMAENTSASRASSSELSSARTEFETCKPDAMGHNRMAYGTRNDANLRRDVAIDQTPTPHASMCVGVQHSEELIYFARCDHHLKIGYTKDFSRRERYHLRNAAKFGQKYRVVAAVHGTRNEEAAIQSHFSKHRIGASKEEFRHDPEITDYVRWLRTQAFVQVPEEKLDGIIRDVPIVEYQGWSPSEERRIPYEPNLFVDQSDYDIRVIMGDDYYTSPDVITLATMALGEIDLDPASHAAANTKIKADKFYTKADNGLVKPWYGRVWLNPPFSLWPEFSEKLLSEWRMGEMQRLLALVTTAALTTRYMEPVIAAADFVVVPSRRYRFWGPHATSEPTSGHVLIGYGRTPDDVAAMLRAFAGMNVLYTDERK